MTVSRSGSEGRRKEHLERTLSEISRCFDDAEAIVSFGSQRFEEDWLVRRAAKNVVTEFAESVARLPQGFKDERPGVPWRAIGAMRNLVVHHCEQADFEVIWNVLVSDLPELRRRL